MRARRGGAAQDGDNDRDEDPESESEEEDNEDDNDQDEFKEGRKAPMLPELFGKMCMWLLQWGTIDGIFGALFIALVHGIWYAVGITLQRSALAI
jgi:hypothetical protein